MKTALALVLLLAMCSSFNDALATRVTSKVYEKPDGTVVEVTTTHSVAGVSVAAVLGG